ncbi:hypothetical protein BD310DRAFT_918787, partial [Dichomitus squalens]
MVLCSVHVYHVVTTLGTMMPSSLSAHATSCHIWNVSLQVKLWLGPGQGVGAQLAGSPLSLLR